VSCRLGLDSGGTSVWDEGERCPIGWDWTVEVLQYGTYGERCLIGWDRTVYQG
jgi:hypothetical protein